MTEINFKGKQIVYAHHLGVASKMLEMDAKKSLPPGKKPSLDDNLIIHGDNLHALKALLPRYAGKVNCIYIDPPYNTGNEKWIYNDNVNSPMMKEWLKGKSPVDGEDMERHDKWLCMMWPRLSMLKELLAEDGVIFISIDDNEQHRLRMMMDEIFGGENCITSFIWRKKYGGGKGARFFVDMHEYVLAFAKDIKTLSGFSIARTKEQKEIFIKKDEYFNERGKYYIRPLKSGLAHRKNLIYPIKCPDGSFVETQWICAKNTFHSLQESGRIVFKKLRTDKYNVYKKFYENDSKDGVLPESIIYNLAYNQNAKEEMKLLFNVKEGRDIPFENAKPIKLICHILEIIGNKNAIVLDSFAGSGTTAHAVLALNKEDGGNRKFILVECEDYAHKITAERVRRVIKGVKKSKDENLKNGLGGSFTYCTLGDEISIEKMLTGNNLPDYETLARYVVYTAGGKSPAKICKARGKDGFFHETQDRLYYLIYEPNLAFLRSTESALNSDRATRIAKQTKSKNKTAIVFATHKFMGQKELSEMSITFVQLPYEINL